MSEGVRSSWTNRGRERPCSACRVSGRLCGLFVMQLLAWWHTICRQALSCQSEMQLLGCHDSFDSMCRPSMLQCMVAYHMLHAAVHCSNNCTCKADLAAWIFVVSGFTAVTGWQFWVSLWQFSALSPCESVTRGVKLVHAMQLQEAPHTTLFLDMCGIDSIVAGTVHCKSITKAL
jgi:hypothetical protein